MNIFNIYYLFIPILFLFFIGLVGVAFIRRNMLIVLMSIELMLLAINLNFINFACSNDDVIGIIFSFFILTIAAAESAIGLSLLVIFFRNKSIISVDAISMLKG
jgi:NADH-quinone oxidoreductase subunit K